MSSSQEETKTPAKDDTTELVVAAKPEAKPEAKKRTYKPQGSDVFLSFIDPTKNVLLSDSGLMSVAYATRGAVDMIIAGFNTGELVDMPITKRRAQESGEDGIKAVLTKETSGMISKNNRLLVGTSVVDVGSTALAAVLAAVTRGVMREEITVLCVGIFVAFTTSRDFAPIYTNLSKDHFMSGFDIEARDVSSDANNRDSWVKDCKMNATAMRILGQLCAECAPPGTTLKKLAESKGTILNPKTFTGDKDKMPEYIKLCVETKATLTAEDIHVFEVLSKSTIFSSMLRVLSHAFVVSHTDIAKFANTADGIAGSVFKTLTKLEDKPDTK